jgi:hypothetical protein
MLPRARREKLVVQELGDEVLVYDLDRHRAHCLNAAAALVWRRCDGETSLAEIAAALERDLRLPADEAIVSHALDRLDRAHLLASAPAAGTMLRRMSRRDLASRTGLAMGATLLLPVVISIVAPTPAYAASCIAKGQACVPGGQPPCCPGCTCGTGSRKCGGSC